jgi:hypothetical protein
MLGIVFLIVQSAYLCLVLFDNTTNSEAWMFLALTYIPITVTLFLVMLVLGIATFQKEEKAFNKAKALLIIPTHAFMSYLILILWGYLFNFPL